MCRDLPQGYAVERDADVQKVLSPNGKTVAQFTPGASSVEISLAAYRHAYEVQKTFGKLQRLLSERREKARGQTYPAAGLGRGFAESSAYIRGRDT